MSISTKAVPAIQHYIGGERVARPDAESLDVYNPGSGAHEARVPVADANQVSEAVAAARAAARPWGRQTLASRTAVMFALRSALIEHAGELADLIVRENGKTAADARAEIGRGVECVEHACGLGASLAGTFSAEVATGVDVHSVRQPLGVVGAITPFNFPIMVPLWMLSTALAAGNAAVLKPSERCPSAPTRMAEILGEAGLPAGVLNVVHGDATTVDALISHPTIAAISFVGSTNVARQIYKKAADAGKRVQALGGAKNHAVVMPDADFDSAASAIIAGAFGAAGQRCMSVSVLVAVGDSAQPIVAEIEKRAGRIMVGQGSAVDTEMGALITPEHRDRVAAFIESATNQGATLRLDGREHGLAESDGFFIGPTLVDYVTTEMDVYRHEVFGPVLSVVRVDTLDEALDLIDENEYGNGAVIFTRSGGDARRFEQECTAGMLGVNVPIPVPVPWSSFGGWKSSLFGVSHMYGPEGFNFFTRQKVITSRWPDLDRRVDRG